MVVRLPDSLKEALDTVAERLEERMQALLGSPDDVGDGEEATVITMRDGPTASATLARLSTVSRHRRTPSRTICSTGSGEVGPGRDRTSATISGRPPCASQARRRASPR